MKNKKGVSVMIGYILLIVFAIVMGGVLYQWMKTYIPQSPLNCPDGISIYIEDYSFNCTTLVLNLSIKNDGRFNVAGYFIRGTENESQEISTIDISSNIFLGGVQVGNAILFSPSNENLIKPNQEIKSIFNLSNKIYSVELIPVRFQEEDNRQRLVTCGRASIKKDIICKDAGCAAEPQNETCGDWICGIRTNNCNEDISCGTCEEGNCEDGACISGLDEYTKLLLHMDGTDGSTTFIDSSNATHTTTPYGHTHQEIDDKKFGTSSGYFDGYSDYLLLDTSSDWDFGTGDWTIDGWINFEPANEYSVMWMTGGENYVDGVMLGLAWNGYYFQSHINKQFSNSTDLSGGWHHLAATRSGDTTYHFVDGELIGTMDVTGVSMDASYRPKIGNGYAGGISHWVEGYIDELRISKGIARWTSDFAVPTSAYG